MRRSDREVTDERTIDRIIDSADCCRIGFVDGNEAYIVPMNFGSVKSDGRRVFYFHSAKEGRKLELVKARPEVSFELDSGHELITANVPCGFGFRYNCVMGRGVIGIVTDRDEKRSALDIIMSHYTGHSGHDFPENAENAVTVLRIDVTELSCKVHE